MRETDDSLTLDTAALTRAADALSEDIKGGYSGHFCAEWQVDGVCEVCWTVAAAVIRAAEGLAKCGRCKGGGMIAPGDSCPECGGNGLELLSEARRAM